MSDEIVELGMKCSPLIEKIGIDSCKHEFQVYIVYYKNYSDVELHCRKCYKHE